MRSRAGGDYADLLNEQAEAFLLMRSEQAVVRSIERRLGTAGIAATERQRALDKLTHAAERVNMAEANFFLLSQRVGVLEQAYKGN